MPPDQVDGRDYTLLLSSSYRPLLLQTWWKSQSLRPGPERTANTRTLDLRLQSLKLSLARNAIHRRRERSSSRAVVARTLARLQLLAEFLRHAETRAAVPATRLPIELTCVAAQAAAGVAPLALEHRRTARSFSLSRKPREHEPSRYSAGSMPIP